MSSNPLDNNGQNKLILSDNPSFTFVHTKAERLSTAVHLITRAMGGDEPLRRHLRSESITLLSRIFILDERSGDSVSGIIVRIISLLDIAYRTQYISEMNWNVIRSEYVSFADFLKERNLGAAPESQTISKNFFDIEEPKAISEARQRGEIQRDRDTTFVKDKIESKGHTAKPKPKGTKSPAIKERKNGRREVIIKLLKERKKVTVRDVAEVIPNVSEKTLQRELIALVVEGSLRREGERRWSTYFLA